MFKHFHGGLLAAYTALACGIALILAFAWLPAKAQGPWPLAACTRAVVYDASTSGSTTR